MNTVAVAKSRLAVEAKRAKRSGLPQSDQRVRDAQRDLAAAKLEAFIRDVVKAAPELTVEQRLRLQALLAMAPVRSTS